MANKISRIPTPDEDKDLYRACIYYFLTTVENKTQQQVADELEMTPRHLRDLRARWEDDGTKEKAMQIILDDRQSSLVVDSALRQAALSMPDVLENLVLIASGRYRTKDGTEKYMDFGHTAQIEAAKTLWTMLATQSQILETLQLKDEDKRRSSAKIFNSNTDFVSPLNFIERTLKQRGLDVLTDRSDPFED